jgi:hypothetical protein
MEQEGFLGLVDWHWAVKVGKWEEERRLVVVN